MGSTSAYPRGVSWRALAVQMVNLLSIFNPNPQTSPPCGQCVWNTPRCRLNLQLVTTRRASSAHDVSNPDPQVRSLFAVNICTIRRSPQDQYRPVRKSVIPQSDALSRVCRCGGPDRVIGAARAAAPFSRSGSKRLVALSSRGLGAEVIGLPRPHRAASKDRRRTAHRAR